MIHVKRLIKNILSRVGIQVKLVNHKDMPLSLWDSNEEFNIIFKEISGYTIVDKIRCFIIYQYARQACFLQGEAAEVGAYKGGTAKLLSKVFASSGKAVYIFDTFSGMPFPDPRRDIYKKGDFGDTSIEGVKRFLSDCKNISIYQGVFPSTSDPIANKKFCLAHIDVDIYKSVIDCCDFFYPRLEKGGVMIFDDYGFPLCPGAKKAVDEFFSKKIEKPCYLPTGQCVIIKL